MLTIRITSLLEI